MASRPKRSLSLSDMTVRELIDTLQKLPAAAPVGILYDGEVRMDLAHAYAAKEGGGVVVTGRGEVCYSNDGRPASAPYTSQDRYWKTPE